MKSLLSLLTLLLAPVIALAQIQPDWVRYPAISPDGSAIVFTYMGDLYRVSSDGGEARQLTFHEAHDFMPVWSNDGTKLAFASNRYGNFDIFVMDAMGGPAVRLTWHSNDEHPYSFSHDDQHIIFGGVRQDLAEHRQFPTASMSELYQVPVRGGRVSQVFTVPAEMVQVSRDGSRMLYQDKKGGENEWRKHHVSAIARDIWMYEPATNRHTMLTTFGGEDRQPVFSADQQSMYYLSAENGTFNVHRMRLPATTQATSEQITQFETHPVRFLSQGGGRLAFTWHGELYTMRENGQPTRVPVVIRTQSGANSDKFISINGGVSEMAISPNGKEIAFIARGEVFVTTVDGAMTKRITNTAETERFVTFTPDGNAVMYASERDGRWSIYQTERVRTEEPFFFASTLLRERAVVSTDVDAYMPQVSPDGTKLAYISDRRNLVVRNLATGAETRLLDNNDLIHMRDGDQYFTWSPDSRWLLFDFRKRLSMSDVLLIAADGSRRVNLTESGYSDSGAKWVNGGKNMIWFSDRDGLRSYASSGRTETDVYALFFTQEAWDTFNLTEDEFKLRKAVEAALKKDETTAAAPSAGNRRGAAASGSAASGSAGCG
jgi:tricorn protease